MCRKEIVSLWFADRNWSVKKGNSVTPVHKYWIAKKETVSLWFTKIGVYRNETVSLWFTNKDVSFQDGNYIPLVRR